MKQKTDDIIIPLADLTAVDVSEKAIENRARGFILGSTAIGRRKEVRELLEDKVIQRIGKKGKYLTDKLFELIEGVYIVDKVRDGMGKNNASNIRYYKVPPNLNAITYALDRVLGKPTQKVEKDREKEGITVIESMIKDLAKGTIEHRKEVKIVQ